MTQFKIAGAIVLAALAFAGPAAFAQSQPSATSEQPAEAVQDSLKVYFPSGSAAIAGDQTAVLDQAARLFRDGNPIVMVVSGVADTVGAADHNLKLSIQRAQAVADGLTARGIPAERLQVAGRGNSELEIETGDDTASRENRIAEITWR